MSFVHLHTHTEFSLLDGLTRVPEMVDKCAQHGMPAVAMTDHGNMFGIMRLLDACEKSGGAVKPIFGCEVYVAPRSRHDRKLEAVAMGGGEGLDDCVDPSGQRDAGYHLVLLAKNLEGFANLSKLVSLGYTEGFYYKPRVDMELLGTYSRGLVCLSACLGGEVQARLLNGSFEVAEKVARVHRDIFGEDYYLEIQDQGFESEKLIIPMQFELSKKTGIPLVLANDAHYLNADDFDLHDTLLCIGTKKQKNDASRMRFSSDQFYLKTPEEMARLFPDRLGLSELTLEIANKINVFPITRDPVTPNFPVPAGFDLSSYFVQVAREWFEKRMEECRPLWAKGLLLAEESEYRARLESELGIILKMGFPGYFLMVWDFIGKAREMGVPVGPGRGSAAGSIVAWAMRITDIDPMQYGLLFERFLNPERKSMPDVDIDFCRDGRQRVIDYVTEKYGRDKVCNIVTINAMKAKAVIKDVARAYSQDFNWSNELTKLVPRDLGITVKEAIEKSDQLRSRYKEPEVRKILDIADRLEGISRNTGLHAAGVIIAPDELTKFAPLCKDKDDKIMVQYDKKDVERVGLMKMDFLGLETLTQIEKVQGYISQRHGKPADLDSIWPFNDPKTLKLFCQGDTDGVFQFESPGMRQLLQSLQPDRFDDLVALNALYRPGPLGAGMHESYVKRRHGREKTEYSIAELEPILKPTYGVILFQEQVMQIAQAIAGFSLGEADVLRDAMGKKDIQKMKKGKSDFVKRSVERGYDKKKATDLFNTIEHFAGYGFNKSHSAAYAMLAFKTAYLKANYRTEFMAGLLSAKSQRTEDVAKYIANCREQGIDVLGPDINESNEDFTITKNGKIRFGLAAIKGLGVAALGAILDARKKEGGMFKDVFHALKSTDLQKANKKVWESLIKAGALDTLEQNRAAILHGLPSAIENASKGGSKDLGLVSLFDEAEMATLADAWAVPEGIEPWGRSERLTAEKEALGLYVSGHQLEEFADAIKVHTIGSIARMKELASAGKLKDKEEVSLAVMVAGVNFKTNKNGEPWAILALEDLTDKAEALLMATGGFDPVTKQKIRPFNGYRHLAMPQLLLKVTGEIRIEAMDSTIEEDDESPDQGLGQAQNQMQIKIFAKRLELLEDYQGRGLTGALIELPLGQYPLDLLIFLKRHGGRLPITLEYKSSSGYAVKIRAGSEHGLAYSSSLADKLRAETGCELRWLS
jgi:DNA polymerase-3 subunit alpha